MVRLWPRWQPMTVQDLHLRRLLLGGRLRGAVSAVPADGQHAHRGPHATAYASLSQPSHAHASAAAAAYAAAATTMDKQDTDSLATVTVKEYPPSEVFGSEPPPAYQKLRPNSVQIARIAAVTLVTMSVILGLFILAASYVNATYSCQNIHMHHGENGASEEQPSFQHLVDPLQSEESAAVAAAAADTNRLGAAGGARVLATPASGAQQQSQSQQSQRSSSSEEEDDVGGGESDEVEDDDEEPQPVRIKLPLTLDFDDLAGALVERNQRSRMNCVVEKRRAEQVVDHQPRTLRLPFGVNLTTDPRYEHVSGERMAIFCESGKEQRHMPMDMMAATPVVVPLPGPVHLPIQFHGHLQQAQNQAQAQAQAQAAAMEQARAHAAAMEQARAQAQTQARARSFPQPHPHQVLQQLHQHLMHQQQLKEQHLQRMQQMKEQQEMAEQEREQMRDREHAAAAAAAMHASIRVIEKALPIQIAESRHIPIQVTEARQVPVQMAEAHHIPLQLTEARHIPIQMAEARPVALEEATAEEAVAVAREGRAFQGDSAPFPRLPVHVPVPLMQAVAVEQPQPRPHYVQPRSVRAARSVDDVFLHKREKRMRRCACDCSC